MAPTTGVPLGAGYLELMAIADPEEAVAIAREGLTARLVGVGEALRQPSLPFFIERDEGVRDPGEAGEAGGITWLEVAGDAGALSPLLGGADLPVRMVPGPAGVRAMGIGDRELRNA